MGITDAALAASSVTSIITSIAGAITALALLVTALGVLVPQLKTIVRQNAANGDKLNGLHTLVHASLESELAAAKQALKALTELAALSASAGIAILPENTVAVAAAKAKISVLEQRLAAAAQPETPKSGAA